MYTLFIPCDLLVIQPAFFRTSSFAKRLPWRCSFIFGNRKKSDDARSGLHGGCSKMSQWNCSRSKACVYRTVCGDALSCIRTIPRVSLPLRQENLRSHRPEKTNNISHLTVMATAISAFTTWQGPTYNCMRQPFNITLTTRNQWLAATKQVRGRCELTFFTLWMAFVLSLMIIQEFVNACLHRT